ncbi:MAG TPA: hypothetical protein VHO25_05355 [Polyangiaceae bacterium]|nr:hypothetical protein [Polyangiaceae bacterium]
MALVVGACDGDTVYSPPHAHPPASGEALPPDPVPSEEQLLVRAATCEYTARCRPKELGLYPGGDRKGCLEARFCRTPSVARNAVVDFDACLDSLRTAPCAEVVLPGQLSSFQSPSPCAQAPRDYSEYYVGKPGLGETCLSGQDEFPCSEGWCRIEEPRRQSGAQFCGVCTAALEEGDPCTEADRCGDGTRCLEGICRALLENGEPCSNDEQCYRRTCLNGQCAYPQDAEPPPPNYGERLGDPCSHNLDCGYDPTLNCVSGVCVPSPDRGEPCDDLQDCRVGLGCHEGVCEDVPCFVDLGGFCGASLSCGTPDSFCDDSGHCAKLPVEGEPCSDWLVECANGLICDLETNHCIRRPPLRSTPAPGVEGCQ